MAWTRGDIIGAIGIGAGVVGVIAGGVIGFFTTDYYFEKGIKHERTQLERLATLQGVEERQIDAAESLKELYDLIVEYEASKVVETRLEEVRTAVRLEEQVKGREECRTACSTEKAPLEKRIDEANSEIGRLEQEIIRAEGKSKLQKHFEEYRANIQAAYEIARVDDIARLTSGQRRRMLDLSHAIVRHAMRGRAGAQKILEALNGNIEALASLIGDLGKSGNVDFKALKILIGTLQADLGNTRDRYVDAEDLFVSPVI